MGVSKVQENSEEKIEEVQKNSEEQVEKVKDAGLDQVQLGGNIVLSGFRDIDGGSKLILRKIVGSYARKLSDATKKFEQLALDMKQVHATEGSQKFNIKGKLIDDGKVYTSEVVDRNLFVAIDSALKKLESALN